MIYILFNIINYYLPKLIIIFLYYKKMNYNILKCLSCLLDTDEYNICLHLYENIKNNIEYISNYISKKLYTVLKNIILMLEEFINNENIIETNIKYKIFDICHYSINLYIELILLYINDIDNIELLKSIKPINNDDYYIKNSTINNNDYINYIDYIFILLIFHTDYYKINHCKMYNNIINIYIIDYLHKHKKYLQLKSEITTLELLLNN